MVKHLNMKPFKLDNLIRENVKRLKPYSSARDEFKQVDADLIFLDANENPFENGVNRYPDPQQRNLKSVLAAQKKLRENQILLGNGSDEVLDLIFRAFCEPYLDNVITLPPTYGMYKVLAETNAIENREVLLNDCLQPNISAVLKRADKKSKLLFICSPNNPTGNRLDDDKIQNLLENFTGLVVIDEAYIDFSTSLSWIHKLEEFSNLIITQTLSKAYGMAGIRLGICYASAAIISVLNKIKPPYNVNELTQLKALERVLDQTEVKKEVVKIVKERDNLIKSLKDIPYIKHIYETDANFVLVRVDDANLRYRQLIGQGVVVRNRSTQPLCENTLRFTIGTSQENMKLMEALQKI